MRNNHNGDNWMLFSVDYPEDELTLLVMDKDLNYHTILPNSCEDLGHLSDIFWQDVSEHSPVKALITGSKGACVACGSPAEYSYTEHYQVYNHRKDLIDRFHACRLCKTCLTRTMTTDGRVRHKNFRRFLMHIPENLGFSYACGWEYSKKDKSFFRLHALGSEIDNIYADSDQDEGPDFSNDGWEPEEHYYKSDYPDYTSSRLGSIEGLDKVLPLCHMGTGACFFEGICNRASTSLQTSVVKIEGGGPDCLIDENRVKKCESCGALYTRQKKHHRCSSNW